MKILHVEAYPYTNTIVLFYRWCSSNVIVNVHSFTPIEWIIATTDQFNQFTFSKLTTMFYFRFWPFVVTWHSLVWLDICFECLHLNICPECLSYVLVLLFRNNVGLRHSSRRTVSNNLTCVLVGNMRAKPELQNLVATKGWGEGAVCTRRAGRSNLFY